MEQEGKMRKELKNEICNFLTLFIAAGLGIWFAFSTVIAVLWMIGLV